MICVIYGYVLFMDMCYLYCFVYQLTAWLACPFRYPQVFNLIKTQVNSLMNSFELFCGLTELS